MQIKLDDGTVEIRKSVGRMLTLMFCTGLPLRRYDRGLKRLYTLPPYGPQPGREALYDWRRSSPVRSQPHHVEEAMTAGYLEYVVPFGPDFRLTPLGRKVAAACVPDWEPEIAAHFAGRGVPWVEGARNQAIEDDPSMAALFPPSTKKCPECRYQAGNDDEVCINCHHVFL